MIGNILQTIKVDSADEFVRNYCSFKEKMDVLSHFDITKDDFDCDDISVLTDFEDWQIIERAVYDRPNIWLVVVTNENFNRFTVIEIENPALPFKTELQFFYDRNSKTAIVNFSDLK